ncbi:MAG: hypothetical protein V7739_10685 [Motiliproteus sp.]
MKTGFQGSALLLVFLFFLAAMPVTAADQSHLLDGKTFSGQNGEKGHKANRDDDLIFKNGKFISTSCYDYDFASGDYTATVIGDSIQFKAITISPEHGKLTWQGTMKDNKMEASFIWTKERWYWDVRREYWFKGVLKP